MKAFVKTMLAGTLALFLILWGLDGFGALAAGRKPERSPAISQSEAPLIAEAAAAGTGILSGAVHLSGSPAAPQKIKMAADPACQQQHSQDVFTQEVVSRNGLLQYALVYVKEGIQGSFPAPTTPFVLTQVGCMYEPHVFALQAGQPLEIRNNDSTLHNINCQTKLNKKFNIAQPTKGMKSSKNFDQPEIGIPFKCNVHPWMAAYGSVFNHPFFSVSGEDGAFSISGLPAGTYTVEAWHEKLGLQTQTVTIAEGEKKTVDFTFAGK